MQNPPKVKTKPNPIREVEQRGGRLFEAGGWWVGRLGDRQVRGKTERDAAIMLLDKIHRGDFNPNNRGTK
jgi:hypothetical protein